MTLLEALLIKYRKAVRDAADQKAAVDELSLMLEHGKEAQVVAEKHVQEVQEALLHLITDAEPLNDRLVSEDFVKKMVRDKHIAEAKRALPAALRAAHHSRWGTITDDG